MSENAQNPEFRAEQFAHVDLTSNRFMRAGRDMMILSSAALLAPGASEALRYHASVTIALGAFTVGCSLLVKAANSMIRRVEMQ